MKLSSSANLENITGFYSEFLHRGVCEEVSRSKYAVSVVKRSVTVSQ